MSINLSSYPAIEVALLVKIECDYFVENPGDTPTSTVIRLTDSDRIMTYNSEDYTPAGVLLGVTGTPSEIRNSPTGVTITISGIPNSYLHEALNSRFKGSRVSIYRMIMDTTNHDPLPIANNPVGRFFGQVNNYSIEEEYNTPGRIASSSITFICSSQTEILSNKVAGRRTNSADEKAFYSTDLSMDRVATLAKSNFNFGAVVK